MSGAVSTTVTPRGEAMTPADARTLLGTPALFATAYGNVGSSIYYAPGWSPESRSD
jgi:hypothetical protein